MRTLPVASFKITLHFMNLYARHAAWHFETAGSIRWSLFAYHDFAVRSSMPLTASSKAMLLAKHETLKLNTAGCNWSTAARAGAIASFALPVPATGEAVIFRQHAASAVSEAARAQAGRDALHGVACCIGYPHATLSLTVNLGQHVTRVDNTTGRLRWLAPKRRSGRQ
jgi:hypothetical protein